MRPMNKTVERLQIGMVNNYIFHHDKSLQSCNYLFHHNKIPLLVVKGTIKTSAKIDKPNNTTTVQTRNNIVIAKKIILDEAAADKETYLCH